MPTSTLCKGSTPILGTSSDSRKSSHQSRCRGGTIVARNHLPSHVGATDPVARKSPRQSRCRGGTIVARNHLPSHVGATDLVARKSSHQSRCRGGTIVARNHLPSHVGATYQVARKSPHQSRCRGDRPGRPQIINHRSRKSSLPLSKSSAECTSPITPLGGKKSLRPSCLCGSNPPITNPQIRDHTVATQTRNSLTLNPLRLNNRITRPPPSAHLSIWTRLFMIQKNLPFSINQSNKSKDRADHAHPAASVPPY